MKDIIIASIFGVCGITAFILLLIFTVRSEESKLIEYRQFLVDKQCVLVYADTERCEWTCGGVRTISEPRFCMEWLNGN